MKELSLAGILAVAVIAIFTIPALAGQPALLPAQITIPNEAVYGHRPVTITVSVTNPYTEEVQFSSKVWHGGPAWGGEDHPAIRTGPYARITNVDCSLSECNHYWGGSIMPGSTAYLDMIAFSGNVLGEFPFISATYEINGQQAPVVTRTILITQGIGSVNGWLNIEGPLPWRPGEHRALALTMESPTLTQFISRGPFTSNCGITDLPGGFSGHFDRTYEKFFWYVNLPENATAGQCTIQGGFTQWPKMDNVVQVHYTFEVPYRYRQFLPLINNSK